MTGDRFSFSSLLSSALLGSAGLIGSASAALVLDPSDGIVIASSSVGGADKDDGSIQGSRDLSASFFGHALAEATPTISLNGQIYFGNGDGNGDYFIRPMGETGMTRIAPMWIDFMLGANGQVVESDGGSYFAVTWLNMENSLHPGYFANFQAIFFEADTTLNGIDFLSGEIVFSYDDVSLYPEISELIVGLEDADGTIATLPGHEPFGGWHSSGAFGDFPVADDEYALFSPNGTGGYEVNILAVPEPSVLVSVAGGFLMLASRRARRC